MTLYAYYFTLFGYVSFIFLRNNINNVSFEKKCSNRLLDTLVLQKTILPLGIFHKLRLQVFSFFWPPGYPLCWQSLPYKSFLDYLPPLLVNVVCERPLMFKSIPFYQCLLELRSTILYKFKKRKTMDIPRSNTTKLSLNGCLAKNCYYIGLNWLLMVFDW